MVLVFMVGFLQEVSEVKVHMTVPKKRRGVIMNAKKISPYWAFTLEAFVKIHCLVLTLIMCIDISFSIFGFTQIILCVVLAGVIIRLFVKPIKIIIFLYISAGFLILILFFIVHAVTYEKFDSWQIYIFFICPLIILLIDSYNFFINYRSSS